MKRSVMLKSLCVLFPLSGWLFTPVSLAQVVAADLPEWCHDGFCGYDFLGNPKACCECDAIFNSSECCYNTTFCRCEANDGLLWCDTDCPCDDDASAPPTARQPPGTRLSVIAGSAVGEILEAEVINGAAGANETIPPAELHSLQQALVNVLTSYFANDPACYLAQRAMEGAMLDPSKRAAIAEALVLASRLSEADAPSKSDAELVQMAWHLGSSGSPRWWGLAFGETSISTFCASSAEELETQSLRRQFGETGGVTWKPIYGNPTLSSWCEGTERRFAEAVIWVGQEDDNGMATVPYLLRFIYDTSDGSWQVLLIWTPSGSKARLIL